MRCPLAKSWTQDAQHVHVVLQDTDDMDYLLPQSVTELGNCLMQLAATLIFVSIVQPLFLAG